MKNRVTQTTEDFIAGYAAGYQARGVEARRELKELNDLAESIALAVQTTVALSELIMIVREIALIVRVAPKTQLSSLLQNKRGELTRRWDEFDTIRIQARSDNAEWAEVASCIADMREGIALACDTEFSTGDGGAALIQAIEKYDKAQHWLEHWSALSEALDRRGGNTRKAASDFIVTECKKIQQAKGFSQEDSVTELIRVLSERKKLSVVEAEALERMNRFVDRADGLKKLMRPPKKRRGQN